MQYGDLEDNMCRYVEYGDLEDKIILQVPAIIMVNIVLLSC